MCTEGGAGSVLDLLFKLECDVQPNPANFALPLPQVDSTATGDSSALGVGIGSSEATQGGTALTSVDVSCPAELLLLRGLCCCAGWGSRCHAGWGEGCHAGYGPLVQTDASPLASNASSAPCPCRRWRARPGRAAPLRPLASAPLRPTKALLR